MRWQKGLVVLDLKDQSFQLLQFVPALFEAWLRIAPEIHSDRF